MSAAPEASPPTPDDLEAAADQAIATCGGDARGAVKALIVANGFLGGPDREVPGGGLDRLRARQVRAARSKGLVRLRCRVEV
jgi:hypothetical protein